MLAPIAPHIAEELWTEALKKPYSIHKQSWPEVDKEAITEKTVNLVIQVNGKLRDSIEMRVGASDEDVKKKALASEKIKKLLDGKEPKRIIVVKNKLINIVI